MTIVQQRAIHVSTKSRTQSWEGMKKIYEIHKTMMKPRLETEARVWETQKWFFPTFCLKQNTIGDDGNIKRTNLKLRRKKLYLSILRNAGWRPIAIWVWFLFSGGRNCTFFSTTKHFSFFALKNFLFFFSLQLVCYSHSSSTFHYGWRCRLLASTTEKTSGTLNHSRTIDETREIFHISTRDETEWEKERKQQKKVSNSRRSRYEPAKRRRTHARIIIVRWAQHAEERGKTGDFERFFFLPTPSLVWFCAHLVTCMGSMQNNFTIASHLLQPRLKFKETRVATGKCSTYMSSARARISCAKKFHRMLSW